MLNISKIWLTDNGVWIRTADGREACHWPQIDEDLCFDGFLKQ